MLAAVLLPGASATAQVPKVLLSDFSEEHGDLALIEALAAYEARRRDPAAPLRTARLDRAHTAEVLRAARALDGMRDPGRSSHAVKDTR